MTSLHPFEELTGLYWAWARLPDHLVMYLTLIFKADLPAALIDGQSCH